MMIQAQYKRYRGAAATVQKKKMYMSIVDRDGGALAKGLKEYLGQFHNLTMIDNNKKSYKESLFYKGVRVYSKRFPTAKNYCLKAGEKLEVTKVPGSLHQFLCEPADYQFSGASVNLLCCPDILHPDAGLMRLWIGRQRSPCGYQRQRRRITRLYLLFQIHSIFDDECPLLCAG